MKLYSIKPRLPVITTGFQVLIGRDVANACKASKAIAVGRSFLNSVTNDDKMLLTLSECLAAIYLLPGVKGGGSQVLLSNTLALSIFAELANSTLRA